MGAKERLAGLALYLGGIVLSILRPPVDRMACMRVPGGEVPEGINPFFLIVELFLIMLGSAILSLDHEFRNYHVRNGWVGLTTGLGVAFIGGYSGLEMIFAFGVLLATIGLFLYKIGGMKDAHGKG